MIKEDELQLMRYFLKAIKLKVGVIDTTGILKAKGITINKKRLVYILNKWTDKGYIDYGTSINYVWPTPQGEEYFKKVEV